MGKASEMELKIDFPERVKAAEVKFEELINPKKPVVFIGTATCGRSAGAQATWDTFAALSEEEGVNLSIYETGCVGLCFA